jgi:polysaccharide deacetylase 2 family uncharacterized protein YibQ
MTIALRTHRLTKNAHNNNDQRFSVEACVRGLAFVAALFLGCFVYLVWKADDTRDSLSERLGSRVVPVMRAEKPVIPASIIPVAPLEAYNFPPAPVPVQQDEAQGEAIEKPVAVDQVMLEKTDDSVSAPASDFSGPLEPAPLNGLYQDTEDGKLPKISANGLTPFMAYKRPFTPDERPVIAIALQDFGLSQELSTQAIEKLPPDVSLIISPYVNDAEAWQVKARADGHEVWLYMPLENKNISTEDIGPFGLVINASLSQNQKRLNWLMSRMTGYAGLASYSDEVMNSMNSMNSITQNIVKSFFARGVGYLEMNPQGASAIETLAVASRSVFVDTTLLLDSLNARALAEAKDKARTKGYAVVVFPLNHRNLSELSAWNASLQDEGLRLAPLSAVNALKETRLSPVPSSPAVPAQASH